MLNEHDTHDYSCSFHRWAGSEQGPDVPLPSVRPGTMYFLLSKSSVGDPECHTITDVSSSSLNML